MKKNIFINHIDYYLPSLTEYNYEILKNNKKNSEDSKKMIKKIGINSRRISDKHITSNYLAQKVAQKIFKKYNKNHFDFLIYCTNSPDYILPPNACLLQNKLGLKKNVGCFDINLSCSGYVYSLGVAKSLIYSNQAENILLITSDTYSKFINKKDYKNRIIFGDGATATVISKKRNRDSFKIHDFIYGTDGSGGEYAIFKNFGTNYLHNKKKEVFDMNGPEILNFALREVPDLINNYLKKKKKKISSIDKFVFHQANKFIIESLQKKLHIPDEKIIIEMKKTGNTVSSSIPLALKMTNKIAFGDKVLLIGFGGGLSWGTGIIEKVI
jgi:3-oxoacyl-[acyl-carrier-protein] synthase-3